MENSKRKLLVPDASRGSPSESWFVAGTLQKCLCVDAECPTTRIDRGNQHAKVYVRIAMRRVEAIYTTDGFR